MKVSSIVTSLLSLGVATAFAPPKLTISHRATPLTAAATADGDNLIMVVGSANQDLTSQTDTLPVLGETVLGGEFRTACGGKGANQAVAAAGLNMAPVVMLCRVGDDVFGHNLLQNFQRVNVQYDEAKTILKDISSGVASIVVDGKSGDNMIIVSPGANYKLTKEDVRNEITKSKPSFVVAQLEILPEVALEALKAGKEVGACTILNPAPAPEGWSFEDEGLNFYPYIDILIPNETELRKLCPGSSDDDSEEKLARQLFEKGVGQAVVVTLGARGAMVVEKCNGGDDISVSFVDAPDDLPARNEPVVDTVGAGDSFCGALSACLANGLSLTEAATFACGVASMSVRKPGAQTSYPTAEELPDCLNLENIKKLATV